MLPLSKRLFVRMCGTLALKLSFTESSLIFVFHGPFKHVSGPEPGGTRGEVGCLVRWLCLLWVSRCV